MGTQIVHMGTQIVHMGTQIVVHMGTQIVVHMGTQIVIRMGTQTIRMGTQIVRMGTQIVTTGEIVSSVRIIGVVTVAGSLGQWNNPSDTESPLTRTVVTSTNELYMRTESVEQNYNINVYKHEVPHPHTYLYVCIDNPLCFWESMTI